MEEYREYVDKRGWCYAAIPLIGSESYAICYQKKPGGGWHRMKSVPACTTWDEAKRRCDELAAKKGWKRL